MRVSVVQMRPGSDKAANIAQATSLIDAAVACDRPDLIALPEMWSCLGGDRATKFAAAEMLPAADSNLPGGAAYEFLSGIARAHGIVVHGGSIGERAGEQLFNTSLIFDRSGREVARYRKIHLFDVTTAAGGYRESAVYGAGDRIVTCVVEGTTIGCAICYDLRFPELFLALRRAGAELVVLPAAFTVETGRDHWEVLLRARAIETQCWFAAPATWGAHVDARGQQRHTYGRSLICSPWGQVVAMVPDEIGWATARAEAKLTERVRREMPVLDQRRLT